MLGVVDGRTGEENRWEQQSRQGGLLTGKLLFTRRMTAWPLPRHGRQNESFHLGSEAALGLPGLLLPLCVAKGQVPAQLRLKLPLLWLGPKIKTCSAGPSWAHTVIFQVESRKVELKLTFWIGPCWGLSQSYMAPGGAGSPLQDGNQVCSRQWFKLLYFGKFNSGTSLWRMWGTSGIILLQAKRGETNFSELTGSLIRKCLVPKQCHSDEQTCLQVCQVSASMQGQEQLSHIDAMHSWFPLLLRLRGCIHFSYLYTRSCLFR